MTTCKILSKRTSDMKVPVVALVSASYMNVEVWLSVKPVHQSRTWPSVGIAHSMCCSSTTFYMDLCSHCLSRLSDRCSWHRLSGWFLGRSNAAFSLCHSTVAFVQYALRFLSAATLYCD